MISEKNILKTFSNFTDVALPLLSIKTEHSYNEALHLVESLIEQEVDDETKPERYLIELLSKSISDYEESQKEITAFINEVNKQPSDIALLRTLIDQNNLTLSNLPEIGHKSLVSKILSGERQLTKSHIVALSKRFSINPALFF